MRRAAYALINLSHLKNNLASIKKIVNGSQIMAVVKADAYGHGMVQVCRSLSDTDAFCVACVNEAQELRESSIHTPILALQGFRSIGEYKTAVTHNIQVVIHHLEQLKILKSLATRKPLHIFVKIDSGMHRLGFEPEQFKMVMSELDTLLPTGSVINLMTHLACADEEDDFATQLQLDIFNKVVGVQTCQQSIANSAAILTWPQSYKDWVRPGLLLYGINPLSHSTHFKNYDFRPVMSLRAPIISIKACSKGDKIGYGGEYCCPRDMVIAVVAAGYADGYPRHLNTSPEVSIHGKHAQIVGRVSMDMITIDVSAIDVEIGDEVEFWGEDIPVTAIAKYAETISYELLCNAGSAVNRKFLE